MLASLCVFSNGQFTSEQDMSDSYLLEQVSQQVSEPPLQSLLQQGLDLMIFGMSTVFIFLAVLVAVTTLVSVVIRHFFPDNLISEPPLADLPRTSPQTVDPLVGKPGNDEAAVKYHGKLERYQLLKILQKAVDQYRSDH